MLKSHSVKNFIEKKYSFPFRIGLFPGLSCMFQCSFCGRNYDAVYKRDSADKGVEIFKKIIDEAPPGDSSRFFLSGGLEPLTNPKLGRIIKTGSDLGFKLPLITNAYSLTEGYIKKNPEIWLLDSLRVSLYGHDDQSYKEITQLDKSFKMVKKK